jgi:peptidoglycan/xylan/chitin deacetylase (PgdA/CDA1 family)
MLRTTTSTCAVTTTQAPAEPAQVVRRGRTDRSVVALTFDAGSDSGHTAEILDRLAAAGAVATFGITGDWARANPALLRAIAAAGHQVVNHGDHHRSWTGRSTDSAALTTSQRRDEVTGGAAALRASGVDVQGWFRAPYGDTDPGVDADLGSFGYRYDLLWTVDSLGWKGLTAIGVTKRCLDGAVNGAIYLMHVGADSTDSAALADIITGLRARGYTFATVADLL